MKVVDIHSHFFPKLSQRDASKLDETDGPWLNLMGAGKGMIMKGSSDFRPVREPLWDPAARLREMDRAGIDIKIICATPILFGYAVASEKVVPWSQMINDKALEMCAVNPRRLKALCQVPLQDTDAACKEVEHAASCGHIGVQIGNHVSDKNLDDEGLVDFLAHCAGINMPILVHPWDMMAGERMPNYMLQWLVGMPAETQLAILSLILSGAFERLPRSLKICFAHGGGNFAFQLGWVDNAWRQRDIVRKNCPHPPSTYVDRFYVDSAVFSGRSLAFLVEVMGEDRVMLGSDYPFPLGEQTPGELVWAAGTISANTKQLILADNAMAFFGIEVETTVSSATG